MAGISSQLAVSGKWPEYHHSWLYQGNGRNIITVGCIREMAGISSQLAVSGKWPEYHQFAVSGE
jgi:hypothetical protein